MIFHRNEYSRTSVISQRGGPSKLWSEGFDPTVWLTNDKKYNLLARCVTRTEDHAYSMEYDYSSGREDGYEFALPEV